MKKILIYILIFSVLAVGKYINDFFPVKYTEEVEYMAELRNLDRALIYAVIKVESGFRETVISHRGAVGLMQVLPSTANWILEVNNYNPENYDLYNPRDNIFVGSLYLRYLHDRFDNDLEKVTAAYNGGSSRIQNEVWKEIEETRLYVKKVRIAYFAYRWKLRIAEVLR